MVMWFPGFFLTSDLPLALGTGLLMSLPSSHQQREMYSLLLFIP